MIVADFRVYIFDIKTIKIVEKWVKRGVNKNI